MLRDEVRTDQEIYKDAAAEWTNLIYSLWDAVGKPIDERRAAVYVDALTSVPMGLLKPAVTYAIRNNGNYQTVPTVSAVWAGVRAELRKDINLSDGEPITDEVLARWIDARWAKCAVLGVTP
jgi:hypothetical protein